MSRTTTLLATALIASLCLVLAIGAIASARAPTSPPEVKAVDSPARPATALSAAGETCYSWDFLNNTGQDVNDLHIRLQGVKSLTEVYTGTLNLFGEPDASSGYDAANDSYHLDFTNGIAYDSDKVQLGVCTDRSSLRLGSPSPAFSWTVTSTQALPDPLFAGLSVNWLDHTHAQIDVFNEQNITLTLWSLSVLDPDQPLPLEDLSDDIAMLLPMASEVVTDPLTLLPSANQTFNVEVASANHPYVIEAVLSAEDDPGNLVHTLVQTLSPPYAVYLPLVWK